MANNENSERLYFLRLQNQCRWWVQPWSKKMLAPWKKRYDQSRQHIKKLRHYFADKCLSSQSCGFILAMYGCESWTIRKAEHWRIDAFGFWCWRRLLRVTWTARRSTQSILKEISPEYSLERLMLKLKLQYLDKPMWRTDSLENDADAGKDWWQEKTGTTEDEMVGCHHRLGQEFEQTPGAGVGQGSLECCSPWDHKESDTTEWPNGNKSYYYWSSELLI